MKRLLAALAFVLVLAGCSSSGHATQHSSAAPTLTRDQALNQAIAKADPYAGPADITADKELVADVCKRMATGAKLSGLAFATDDPAKTRRVAAAGAKVWCPTVYQP